MKHILTIEDFKFVREFELNENILKIFMQNLYLIDEQEYYLFSIEEFIYESKIKRLKKIGSKLMDKIVSTKGKTPARIKKERKALKRGGLAAGVFGMAALGGIKNKKKNESISCYDIEKIILIKTICEYDSSNIEIPQEILDKINEKVKKYFICDI